MFKAFSKKSAILLAAAALSGLSTPAASAQTGTDTDGRRMIGSWSVSEDEGVCAMFLHGGPTRYAIFGPGKGESVGKLLILNNEWTSIEAEKEYPGKIKVGELGSVDTPALGMARGGYHGYLYMFPVFEMADVAPETPITYFVDGKEVGVVKVKAELPAFQWMHDCSLQYGGIEEAK